MNKHAIIQVLRYVYNDRFIPLKTVREYILDNAKENRKGLQQEEIIEKGLNIYPKKGISIDSLLEAIVSRGYVEVKQDKVTKIRLTPKGLRTLTELYTNNFCEDFLSFRKEVNALTRKRNETDFDPIHVASMFYHNDSIEEVVRTYFKDQPLQEETQAYHEYMLDKYGLKPNQNDILFHLVPKLFLPITEVHEDIDLTINLSIKNDLPEKFIVDLPKYDVFFDSPYPNNRYAVAGVKIGKEKITTGFYLIIAPRNEFPKNVNIQFQWEIGRYKSIIHDIDFSFEIDRGNLFSTEQSLLRSNALPSIRVTTDAEDIEKNHLALVEEKGKKILMKHENVVLTSFPMHLHSCFLPDKHYKRWRNSRFVRS